MEVEILCREHIRQFSVEKFRLPSQPRYDTGLFAGKSPDDKTCMLTCNVVARLSSGIVNKCVQIQTRSEEHTSELQSRQYLVCRLLLEKKKKTRLTYRHDNISSSVFCY